MDRYQIKLPGAIYLFSQEFLWDYQRSLCVTARKLDCEGLLKLAKRVEPVATSDDQ